MNAHAAVRPHRVRLHADITVPVLSGLAFGAYAGWLDRDGGAATHSAIILGVVGAAVAGALALAIGRVQASLPREMVAAAYAALFGSATGYLNSLCGANTWLKAGFIGFFLGAGMFLVVNYVLLYHRKD